MLVRYESPRGKPRGANPAEHLEPTYVVVQHSNSESVSFTRRSK